MIYKMKAVKTDRVRVNSIPLTLLGSYSFYFVYKLKI